MARFVQDLVIDPPSLLELAGRVVKIEKVSYEPEDLPKHITRYLHSAQRCVNPQCKGKQKCYILQESNCMYTHIG